MKNRKGKNTEPVYPHEGAANGFWTFGKGTVKPIDASNDMGYDPPDPPMGEQDSLMDDPFGDGAVDPELTRVRSEDLTKKQGEFWMAAGQTEDMTSLKEEEQPSEAPAELAWYRKPRTMRLLRMGGIVVGFAAVLLVLFFVVFQVTDIRVKGNAQVSAEHIASLSGIKRGNNIMLLDEAKIEKSINQHPYLIFVCLEKMLPGRVVIQVQERHPEAYISYCGIIYAMDSRGMVLYSNDDAQHPPALLRLEGLAVRSCGVGRRVAVLNDLQMTIFMEVMREIKAMDMTALVTELYVNDVDNIYLGLADGCSVRMGSPERLHAKLRALKLTHAELDAMGKGSGTVDVSKPETPTYIPEVTMQ